MIIVLITAVVLYFSIQLLQRDRAATDFGTAFTIVFVPALIIFLGNLAIGLLGLPPLLTFVPMALAIVSIFLISKHAFEWGNKKSLILTAIYFLTLVVSEVGITRLVA
ncbi:hypothetical protein KDN34_10165 [Shewanella yunxiaonensis]|uniref:Uncharacterized protein n=1 Tax=Shewanella yunxiaonensis TaxID=2829809 RepID=A0ABX7YR20_9GAMM|nr:MULTISPECIES: hypothetical protein [Shewanella]MDF0533629.1 hypothetical protein [Shewanella sp. A32]QUN04626.1 hypothetical protein KDN34_10165 [Shewanella yunxiaonensis]